MYPSKTQPERTADGLVHAISLVGLLIASVLLVRKTASVGDGAMLAGVLLYCGAVLSSVRISYAYHLLPRHDLRPALRRWDHAAIYAVIAGTFTPLLLIASSWTAYAILVAIWTFAVMDMCFKMVATTIDGRWSLISYLGMGWFGLFALPDFLAHLPAFSTWAIAAGGLFYTIGTLFYRNKGMRFRYPIWHLFGTLGGGSFLAAIWVAIEG